MINLKTSNSFCVPSGLPLCSLFQIIQFQVKVNGDSIVADHVFSGIYAKGKVCEVRIVSKGIDTNLKSNNTRGPMVL